jgi:hypothetical protein
MNLATMRPPNDGAPRCGMDRVLRITEGLDPDVGREFARITSVVVGKDTESAAGPGRLLNPTGAPLELSFNLSSQDLRYTMEVGGYETTPAGRLSCIDALLTDLGVCSDCGGVAREFPALQPELQLAWGAWLGVRQSYRNTHTVPTQYKIYAEVQCVSNAAAKSLLERYLGIAPAPTGQYLPLVMVGAALGAERCEFYFDLGSRTFTLTRLRGLLDRVGLARRLDDLVAMINSFEFRHGRTADALPRAHYGFSYSVLPGGHSPVLSVFTFADDLAGGDAWIRRKVLALACRRGIELRGYEAVTEPMSELYFRSAFHNMLTFSVNADDSPPVLQVSVSPPPDWIDED